MRVRVTHDIGDLANDCVAVIRKLPREAQAVVNEGARAGNMLARDFARGSAGKHGKHYPNSMTTEAGRAFRGFGAAVFSAEYGPVLGRKQGGMSFEYGSRNQPPHLDLNKSADIVGPALPGEARRMLERLFW